jgi:hypothetical protein
MKTLIGSGTRAKNSARKQPNTIISIETAPIRFMIDVGCCSSKR